ncbi:MAG TPA: nucleotidyltransferase domain-containing protein [Anaerolineae bacterium]|nr:nucleotidyltransferase domain-containing protein [Anaerolineae bacterium]
MVGFDQVASDRLIDQDRRIALAFIDKLRQHFPSQLVTVILFGSRARGEAAPDSDMDLLVVLTEVGSETQRRVSDLAVEIWLDHGVFLTTLVWSQAHWRQAAQLPTSLYRNIDREGIELFHATPA